MTHRGVLYPARLTPARSVHGEQNALGGNSRLVLGSRCGVGGVNTAWASFTPGEMWRWECFFVLHRSTVLSNTGKEGAIFSMTSSLCIKSLDPNRTPVKAEKSYSPCIMLDSLKSSEFTSTCRFRKLKSLYHDRFSSVTVISRKNSRST